MLSLYFADDNAALVTVLHFRLVAALVLLHINSLITVLEKTLQ